MVGQAAAEVRWLLLAGAFGGNADFTDPSPGSTDGSFVNTRVLPATYEPGAGRRDKLVLRRTDDGCGRAVADDGNDESEVMTATSLCSLRFDDSDSLRCTVSPVPALVGNLDETANRYNNNNLTTTAK